MPKFCKITFENPHKVFYSGQWLRGTVKLSLIREKTIRSIYIEVSGEGYAYWKKDKKKYTANRKYLQERIYLIKGGTNGPFKLMPGSYDYGFEYLLPNSLPTSFEGKRGHIRYTVKCVIAIRIWPDEVLYEPITVIRELDLNVNPEFKKPAGQVKNKSSFLFWLFCASNDVTMTAYTPVSGYVPGQTVNLQIGVNNQSCPKISEFIVQFIKKIAYYVNDNYRPEEHILFEKWVRNENKNQKMAVNIVVPSVPPTSYFSRNIIRVEYVIRIIGSATCCYGDPVLEFPITIGTKPILDIVQPQIIQPDPSIDLNRVIPPQQPSAPPITLYVIPEPEQNTSLHRVIPSAPAPEDDPPKYDDIYLPTYEKATGQLCDMDKNRFRPKYPIFRHPTSYSSVE